MSLIFGHKGSSENYPENTMLAFNKVIEEGGHGIETDIWKSSDGEYVIIHDNTVDRTTSFSGLVSSFTLSQLTNMDAGAWKGSQFEGRQDTKIPSLDLFLETFKNQDILLILQIKLGLNDGKNIIDIVKNKGMLSQCIIFTNRNVLGELKVYEPNAFVMNDGASNDPYSLIMQAVNENWDAISTSPNYYNEDIITLAKTKNIMTQASYLSGDYINHTRHLIDIGVDFILGNNVSQMMKVFEWRKCSIHVKKNGIWHNGFKPYAKIDNLWEPISTTKIKK